MKLMIPETQALMERRGALAPALERIGDLVEVSPESRLVASTMRVQELLDKIADDIEVGRDLVIDSPDMLAEAQEIAGRLAAVASDSGEIERERQAQVGPYNAVVKLINAGYNTPRQHVKVVLDALRTKIVDYDREQRRQAAERAERERREREEAARRAADAELEAKIQAAELIAAAKQHDGIMAAELLQQASQVQDAATGAAVQAVQALHVVAKPTAVRAKGVRGKWEAELLSLDALIVACAERLAKGDRSLVNLLSLDQSAANKLAAALEEGMTVPGLRAVYRESVAIRKGVV